MAEQTITLNIPEELYTRIKQRAQASNRSMDEVLMESVASANPPETTKLPLELEAELEKLQWLNDKSLWKVARSHLPLKSAAKIRSLHSKRSSKGLTEEEAKTLTDLLYQYDRYMLLRAKAAVLLKCRGFDISVLVESPSTKN